MGIDLSAKELKPGDILVSYLKHNQVEWFGVLECTSTTARLERYGNKVVGKPSPRSLLVIPEDGSSSGPTLRRKLRGPFPGCREDRFVMISKGQSAERWDGRPEKITQNYHNQETATT